MTVNDYMYGVAVATLYLAYREYRRLVALINKGRDETLEVALVMEKLSGGVVNRLLSLEHDVATLQSAEQVRKDRGHH